MPGPQRCYSLIQTAERSLHPNAVLHQQHNKRWWIQRFIRYSEKCTGCCSPTFGSTSIIGDQQAGRGGAGGAMSQGEGIIWRMIHAVLAPSGDTGDCSNKIILINSGVVRRPCVQQIETRGPAPDIRSLHLCSRRSLLADHWPGSGQRIEYSSLWSPPCQPAVFTPPCQS